MKGLGFAGAAGLCMLVAVPSARSGNEQRTIEAIRSAAVSLTQAVEDLEKEYEAVAVEVEVDSWHGSLVYEVELFDQDETRRIEVKLDMNTAEVLEEKIERAASRKKGDEEKRPAVEAVVESGFGIVQAIALAERQVDGIVYEAELEQKKGVTFVKVEIQGPDGRRKIIVDVHRKSIIPVLRHD
jgi:uncharacterized membrane protein YkoI